MCTYFHNEFFYQDEIYIYVVKIFYTQNQVQDAENKFFYMDLLYFDNALKYIAKKHFYIFMTVRFH